jgi:hypothetical protein
LVNKYLVVAIAVAFVGGTLYTIYFPQTHSGPTGCNRPAGSILLIADGSGYNDSMGHLQINPRADWPVIRVHVGDYVKIYVCNMDQFSAHGFSIDHYFDSGIALMPQDSFSLSFTAAKAGNYTIYCTILCPVHVWMLRGSLVVS